MTSNHIGLGIKLASMVSIMLLASINARAHCDGIDGPVVKSAITALQTGNVNHVLIWVQVKDEPEVKTAFQKTITVRKLGVEARELSDMYFFETLVRLHRAGEGESYTGLKPAGRDLGPIIPAADKAIESGSIEPLLKLFPAKLHSGIRERFNLANSRKSFDPDDVGAGRLFVKTYVEFIHYVEELYTDGLSDHQHHRS